MSSFLHPNPCIFPLVQTDVAQAHSCFSVSLQSHKILTIITESSQSGNLAVCGFCDQDPFLYAKVSYFLIPEHLQTGQIRFCWLLILRNQKEMNPLPAHRYNCDWGCCMGAWRAFQTLAKGEFGLRKLLCSTSVCSSHFPPLTGCRDYFSCVILHGLSQISQEEKQK